MGNTFRLLDHTAFCEARYLEWCAYRPKSVTDDEEENVTHIQDKYRDVPKGSITYQECDTRFPHNNCYIDFVNHTIQGENAHKPGWIRTRAKKQNTAVARIN